MKLEKLQSLKKETLITAYCDLLRDDPGSVTWEHFKLLLEELDPGEILETTEQCLDGDRSLITLIKRKLTIYLNREDRVA